MRVRLNLLALMERFQMVPLQDIDVSTKNGKKMRIMLRSQSNGFFVSLQELITDDSFAGLYSEFSSPLFKFTDAKTAFEYAVESLRVFLSYANDDVSAVNNPCNCELLSSSDQQSVLSQLSLTIIPTVSQHAEAIISSSKDPFASHA